MVKRKKWMIGSVLIALVCVTSLILGSCAPKAAEVPGVTKDTIKIGAYLPMTGPLAKIGTSCQHGGWAYFNPINEQGGIYGRKIDWIVENDEYQPAKTLAACKKLIESDDVFALVGCAGAPTTLAVLDYITEKDVPFVGPYCPVSQLVKPFKRNVFTMVPCFYRQYYLMADYMIDELGAKRIGIIQQAGSPSAIQAVKDRMEKSPDVSIVADETYKIGETDFSSIVLKVSKANPDFILICTVVEPGSLILKEIKKQGCMPPLGCFMGHSSMYDPAVLELAGSAAEGGLALMINKDPKTSNDPEVVEFRERLKKYSPEAVPGVFTVSAYIAAKLFCDGMELAGPNPTREKLVDALESMQDYDFGFMAPITFTPTQHQANMRAIVVKVENGEYVTVTDWLPLIEEIG